MTSIVNANFDLILCFFLFFLGKDLIFVLLCHLGLVSLLVIEHIGIHSKMGTNETVFLLI